MVQVLENGEVERAVDLHERGYRLLLWLGDAFKAGTIAPEAMNASVSSEEGAFEWMKKNVGSIPVDVRPDDADLRAFSNLFSTYLTNTFDLDANPPGRGYSRGGWYCCCPICTWLTRSQHLTPKKVTPAAKSRALKFKNAYLDSIAAQLDCTLTEAGRAEIFGLLGEDLSLCAYAADLLKRMNGIAMGPASLALWRSFAWTPEGSPKKKFKLDARQIMAAQERIAAKVRAIKG